MSYINQKFDLPGAGTEIVHLDRWSDPVYSVQVETGSALVEVTLDRINRGETPVWDTADDEAGTPMTAVTGLAKLMAAPYEAIRITATGATVGRVMQTGAS